MTTSRASRGIALTVGRNVRAARLAAGLTQGQLARELGMADGMAVSNWERGAHLPNERNLIALADLLVAGDVAALYRESVTDGQVA